MESMAVQKCLEDLGFRVAYQVVSNAGNPSVVVAMEGSSVTDSIVSEYLAAKGTPAPDVNFTAIKKTDNSGDWRVYATPRIGPGKDAFATLATHKYHGVVPADRREWAIRWLADTRAWVGSK